MILVCGEALVDLSAEPADPDGPGAPGQGLSGGALRYRARPQGPAP